MMNIHGLHHIAIICSNYETSKKFYTEILGFSILNETFREERSSMKLDLIHQNNIQIELFSFPNSPARVTQPEACGLRHLALQVKDLDENISYLKSHNIPFEAVRIDEHTGQRFLFFKDPDGLPIELVEV